MGGRAAHGPFCHPSLCLAEFGALDFCGRALRFEVGSLSSSELSERSSDPGS